jgi:hypothetical protein
MKGKVQEIPTARGFGPLQYPGQRPPRGWVPSLDVPEKTLLRVLGVYDNDTGYIVVLPIQALTEALVLAEMAHSLGKIDARDAVTLTVLNGTATGVYATRTKLGPVPADEVWFLTILELATPAQAGGITLGNIRVSAWEDSGGDSDGQLVWAAYQGDAFGVLAYAESHVGAPVLNLEQIATPLRLGPGAYLSLCAQITTAALTADRTLTLTPYGWKGKLLKS